MAKYRRKVKQKNPDEAIEEYQIALEGKDRPTWSPEKIQEMAKRFADAGKDAHTIRQKVVDILRDWVPPGMIPNYLRVALKIWKEAIAGTRGQLLEDLICLHAAVNGVDIDMLRALIENVGELRNVVSGLDWDYIRRCYNEKIQRFYVQPPKPVRPTAAGAGAGAPGAAG